MKPTLRMFAVLGVAGALLLPGYAGYADVFWQNDGDNTVGRAASDGSAATQSFLTGVDPTALVATNTHVYWASATGIGRATISGSSADPTFITTPRTPAGLAVSDTAVYWSDQTTGTISRAALSGRTPTTFLSGVSPAGLLVNGDSLYWADPTNDRIGRASLTSSPPTASYLSGATGATALAGDGSYLYWTQQTGNRIGRMTWNGTGPNAAFLTDTGAPATLSGVGVANGYLFWSRRTATAGAQSQIVRANLDGSDLRTSFLAARDPQALTAISSQTVDFPALADVSLAERGVPLTATATSGLPVAFAAGPASVCTASGAQVTLTGAGTCSVSATQAGNLRYLAAPPASQTFTVTSPTPSPTPTPTPTPTIPKPVSGLTATVAHRSLALRWNAAAGATSYRVKVTYKRKTLLRVTMGRTARFTRLKPRKVYTACVTAANPEGSAPSRCVTRRIPRR